VKLADCKEILESRGIEYLCHFTCTESLKGILEYGIQPKRWLNENDVDINFLRQDSIHYEGNEDATSFSIEFPNYKMLWRLMCDYSDVDFVVIVVDIKEIGDLEFDCYSKNASYGYGSSLCNDFEELFQLENRASDLPKYYPTNPQAEIQVFGAINKIHRVFTRDSTTLQELKIRFPDYKHLFALNQDIFSRRKDHSRW
jgi:hypothetical protein